MLPKRERKRGTTYRIKRFYAPGVQRPLTGNGIIDALQALESEHVIKTGLTLEEAQAHCKDPSSREDGVWFDGFNEE